ncbi:MAG: hypothetical protein GXP62_19395 [Oligoflexia bacterium]|nr:hypothetical protein [Oligoflexia bacterium]
MSCNAYLANLVAFADGLTTSPHPNIPVPAGPTGSGGITTAQTDSGSLNLVDLLGFVFPGPGGAMFNVGTKPTAVYTDYLVAAAKWREQWVFRDLPGYQAGYAFLLWSYINGGGLTPAERAALIAEAKANGTVYQIADERFNYKLLPAANDNSLKKPASCVSVRSLYHLWNVVGGTVGASPVGALFTERLTGPDKTVDHWLLSANYQPPAGTTEVLWQKRAVGVPQDLYDFFQIYLFGAKPIGSLSGGRYVQSPYKPVDLV